MRFLVLVLKGFLIGLAFIVPGVSGGTIAIYLGIYDKLLKAIGNVFTDFKRSMLFLLPILIGIALAVVMLAKLIGILLDWNSFVTLMLFIGLIIGGIPNLWKRIGKDMKWPQAVALVTSFLIVLGILIVERLRSGSGISGFEIAWPNLYLIFFLGMIASITMTVPGISGSALLMALGFYTAIVTNVVGNILDLELIGYHLFVLVPFALGVGSGILLSSRFLTYLLDKHPKETYAAIIGFIIASVIVILMEIRDPSSSVSFSDQLPVYQDILGYIKNNPLSLLFGILTCGAGIFITYRFALLEPGQKK